MGGPQSWDPTARALASELTLIFLWVASTPVLLIASAVLAWLKRHVASENTLIVVWGGAIAVIYWRFFS